MLFRQSRRWRTRPPLPLTQTVGRLLAQGENMLRYFGETPFANHTWRFMNSNWYLARFQPGRACLDQRPAFVVYAWRGGEKWSIPAGLCDVSAKAALQFLARLTPRPVDGGRAAGEPQEVSNARRR